MQLRLPLDLTIEADARDLRIVLAYLRIGTYSETARELCMARKTVRRAVGRFRMALERAEGCRECVRKRQEVPAVGRAAHF
jgi:hypothetical protein